MNFFYVYALMDLKTFKYFYVGCSGDVWNRYVGHCNCSEPSTAEICARFRMKNLKPLLVILYDTTKPEKAQIAEQRFAAELHRAHPLVNGKRLAQYPSRKVLLGKHLKTKRK